MPLNSVPKTNGQRMLSILTKKFQTSYYVPIQIPGHM